MNCSGVAFFRSLWVGLSKGLACGANTLLQKETRVDQSGFAWNCGSLCHHQEKQDRDHRFML
jgi:hypothetical protein